MQKPIYFDYAATTPCAEEVLTEMLPFFGMKFGNSNSLHIYGQEAREALEMARSEVAQLVNAAPDEIIFTSGATESNRIAIHRGRDRRGVITTTTEHKSIFDACQEVPNVKYVGVGNDGLVNFSELEHSLEDDIGLVSVCLVNNETGVLQDIARVVDICHRHGVLVHTDATQAFGKIDIDVHDLGVDFLSASGHKVYGPKGVGVLYFNKEHYKLLRVKGSNKDVEFGIRAGTIPVALCVGCGKAAILAQQHMQENYRRIHRLREMLLDGITGQLEEVYINGSLTSNYPGIINISFRGCEGEALMMEASRICVSSGSACTSNRLTISHVLEAMGIKPDIAQSSLRITIGKDTEVEHIRISTEDLVRATNKLRKMSPVWDMIKSGVDIDQVFSCKR